MIVEFDNLKARFMYKTLLFLMLTRCLVLHAIPEGLPFTVSYDGDPSLPASQSWQNTQKMIIFENNLLSDVKVEIAYKSSQDHVVIDLEKAVDPLTPSLKHFRILDPTEVDKIIVTCVMGEKKHRKTWQLVLEESRLFKAFKRTELYLFIRVQWIAQGTIVLPFVLVNEMHSSLGAAMENLDELQSWI